MPAFDIDVNIAITSASFTWDWNQTNLLDIGNIDINQLLRFDYSNGTRAASMSSDLATPAFNIVAKDLLQLFVGNASDVGTIISLDATAVSIDTITTGGTITLQPSGGATAINGVASVSGTLELAGTATRTFEIQTTSPTRGSCLALDDADGSGITYCRVSNGVMTCNTTSCR